jgi:hypothetical protein
MLARECSIYAFDESHEGYADALRLMFGEVKRRWPEVTTLSVLNWTPTPDMPLDIWVTLYPHLDDPTFKAAQLAFQAAGKQVWGYHCVAPPQPQFLNTFLDVPGAKSRLLPWVSALHNLSGWVFCEYIMHSASCTVYGCLYIVTTVV